MRDANSMGWVNRLIRLPIAIVLVGLPGCFGPRSLPVHPVHGRLTVNGQPVANAQIAFHPTDKRMDGVLPVGTSAADGAFQLTTYFADDGAPNGKYAVTVIWPDDQRPTDECADAGDHDCLEGRYADPQQSPIHAVVRPGHNDVRLQLVLPDVDSHSSLNASPHS